MPLLAGSKILISDGLEGHDDNFETLIALWEDLQLSSFEVAAQQPSLDVISFAQTAFFFGVITLDPSKQPAVVADPHPQPPGPLDADTWFPKSTPAQNFLDWADSVSESETETSPTSSTIALLKKPIIQATDLLKDYWFSGSSSRAVEPLFDPADPLHQAVSRLSSKSSKGSRLDADILDDLMGFKTPVNRASSSQHSEEDADTIYSFHSDEKQPAQEKIERNDPFQFSVASEFGSIPKKRKTSRESLEWGTRADTLRLARARRTRNPFDYGLQQTRSPPKNPVDDNKAIGIIYLVAAPLSTSPSNQVGELSLGIILHKDHRGKGYAREAIQLTLKQAFEENACHRIQASLLPLSTKDRMISLLTQQRFGHEGTKRRSFFNPLMGEWQDVTTLAILDTDWAMRTYYKPAPKSLWDELFLRHERERDELLRWEESNERLLRRTTGSTATLRGAPPSEAPSATESESESESSSASKGKGKGKTRMLRRDPYDGESSSDAESDFGGGGFVRRYDFDDGRVGSPTPSNISFVGSPPPGSVSSASSIGSPPRSVSGSEWDMMDQDSSSSSSHSLSDDDGWRG
ncbi:hypothetical protein C8R46DRAFT_1123501 [Mycena filopes]|nr:hypothetical protein C8R46DRAFT_1123501 [Mycena filopes]